MMGMTFDEIKMQVISRCNGRNIHHITSILSIVSMDMETIERGCDGYMLSKVQKRFARAIKEIYKETGYLLYGDLYIRR